MSNQENPEMVGGSGQLKDLFEQARRTSWTPDKEATDALDLPDAVVDTRRHHDMNRTEYRVRLTFESYMELDDLFAREGGKAKLLEVIRDELLNRLAEYAERHDSTALEMMKSEARAKVLEELG